MKIGCIALPGGESWSGSCELCTFTPSAATSAATASGASQGEDTGGTATSTLRCCQQPWRVAAVDVVECPHTPFPRGYHFGPLFLWFAYGYGPFTGKGS